MVTSLQSPRAMDGHWLYIYVTTEPILVIFQKPKESVPKILRARSPSPNLTTASKLPMAIPAKKKEILSWLGTNVVPSSQAVCILNTHPNPDVFLYISNQLRRMVEAFLTIALPPPLLANGDLCRGGNLSETTEFCQASLRTVLLKGGTTQERLLTLDSIF